MIKRLLNRFLVHPAIFVLALLLVFEEWLWETLSGVLARFSRFVPWQRIEEAISHLPPRWALACFIIPLLALLPFKLVGLYLIAHHRIALGISTFVAAKIVGTALVARIVKLTKPALLSLAWFAALYGFVTKWVAIAKGWIKATPSYMLAKRYIENFRRVRRSIFRRKLAVSKQRAKR
jgi:hypothetical protein